MGHPSYDRQPIDINQDLRDRRAALQAAYRRAADDRDHRAMRVIVLEHDAIQVPGGRTIAQIFHGGE